jgi:hypothetical protein
VSHQPHSTSAGDARERLHAAIAAWRERPTGIVPSILVARLATLLTERKSALPPGALEERDHLRKQPRRQRKPNIGRMIAAAERGGKNVTGITTPDGVTLHFGKGESTETSNPWLDDLKATKQ